MILTHPVIWCHMMSPSSLLSLLASISDPSSISDSELTARPILWRGEARVRSREVCSGMGMRSPVLCLLHSHHHHHHHYHYHYHHHLHSLLTARYLSYSPAMASILKGTPYFFSNSPRSPAMSLLSSIICSAVMLSSS